eukprot:TRINITY_DN111234_c0_g1_i1.p1 TRINITY_DN111234_c0_g1~~TRINITY_DN111234_c0_g1_i1.p1  ORF type:complete len:283 (+),score=56.32 TRINITY_DN111234_c0_g1_i1:69-851(+)
MAMAADLQPADLSESHRHDQQLMIPTVMSNAADVRTHIARKIEAANGDIAKPLRNVDPKTGEVIIYSSMEDLVKWLPQCNSEDLLCWSQLPIFRIALYTDRATWDARQTAYVYQVFPEGEDLASALCWWRKRMSQAGRGFAVFEAGFDTTGPIFRTEPPYLCVDATTGECVADGKEQIEEKRALHMKRREMGLKWEKKGMSADMMAKIEAAELLVRDKKRTGHQYMMKGGWITKRQLAPSSLEKYNTLQKKYGAGRLSGE